MSDKTVLLTLAMIYLAACTIVSAQPPKWAVPRDCPPNETYLACGGSCQTECATLGKPCLINHIRCPDGCYCNEGYARDAKGTCIPIGQCAK